MIQAGLDAHQHGGFLAGLDQAADDADHIGESFISEIVYCILDFRQHAAGLGSDHRRTEIAGMAQIAFEFLQQLFTDLRIGMDHVDIAAQNTDLHIFIC